MAGSPRLSSPGLCGDGDCDCLGSRSQSNAPDTCLPPAPGADPEGEVFPTSTSGEARQEEGSVGLIWTKL